ncbi:unnamed protein product [Danaus chrysippus]|uniref:(African queen) hypothetical protein n=1 Tax=Danaus chrysippus TaxID=151541 RepID=A0A8J2QV45_9NEOP|nr:unnamed protein product [Danaus chrysippus]
MSFRTLNSSIGWNGSEVWEVSPLDLDVFYNPDVVIIVLYVVVLTASLSANTLLIFIVIKFQYMRRQS